jgi:hypothetical protein
MMKLNIPFLAKAGVRECDAQEGQATPMTATAAAPAQSPHGGRERRRAPRAPYSRDARLELAGKTPGQSYRTVRVTDASCLGVGLACDEPLEDGREVVLLIDAPDGTALRVPGTLLNTRRLPRGEFAAGMAFDEEQPLLSAIKIDHAVYGT